MKNAISAWLTRRKIERLWKLAQEAADMGDAKEERDLLLQANRIESEFTSTCQDNKRKKAHFRFFR